MAEMRCAPLLMLMLACAAAADPIEAPGRVEACSARCAAVEVECSSNARQATQQCMKTAASGGVDPMTGRREWSGYFCAWFGADHCRDTRNPQACAARYLAIYDACNGWFGSNTARRYLDCGDAERQSLQLCRAELAACEAACRE